MRLWFYFLVSRVRSNKFLSKQLLDTGGIYNYVKLLLIISHLICILIHKMIRFEWRKGMYLRNSFRPTMPMRWKFHKICKFHFLCMFYHFLSELVEVTFLWHNNKINIRNNFCHFEYVFAHFIFCHLLGRFLLQIHSWFFVPDIFL